MRKLETVDRALRLLQCFTDEAREITVGALAEELAVHPSSISRLAGTLAERGFLERAPGSEAFRLGPEMLRLATLALSSRSLLSAAGGPMERLAGRTRETVVLSVLNGDQAIDVHQVDGPHRIAPREWIGRRAPLHASSDGKVLIAFAGGRPAGLDPVTTQTITTRAALEEEVRRVRERGWATSTGELEQGLNGVAAPIFDHTGRCVAAISVSGPEYRLPSDGFAALATDVVAAAREIDRALGFTPAGQDALEASGQAPSG